MAQKALLSVKSLSVAMGSSDIDASDNLPTVLDAIERATVRVEALMYTTLRAATFEDVFYVHDRSGIPLDGYHRLVLSAGYLKEAPTITMGDSPLQTDTPVALSTNLKKGVVLGASDMLGKYVRVSYRAGFLSDVEVPAEVKQSLLCFTPIALLAASGATIDPKVLKPALDKANSLETQGLQIVASQDRRVGAPIKPLLASSAALTAW
jgi:hypothetical protein